MSPAESIPLNGIVRISLRSSFFETHIRAGSVSALPERFTEMVFPGSVSSRKSRFPTVKRGRVYTEYPCKHRWYRGVKLRPIQDEAFLVLTGISVLSGIENNT